MTPIYYRQNSIGLSYFSGGSISNPQASVQVSNSAGDAGQPKNTTTYYLSDQIGSARMLAAAGGWPVSMDIYYPFGQEQSAPTDNNHYKFTGKERDSETGFDYFGARYYASTMGRWLSPDWSAQVEPVPYAKLEKPQSLNLYSYVLDNPTTGIDADGHWGCGGSTKGFCSPGVQKKLLHGANPNEAHQQSEAGSSTGQTPKAPNLKPGPAPTNPDGSLQAPNLPGPLDVNGKPTEWKHIPGSGPKPGVRWVGDGKIPSPDGKGGKPSVVWDPEDGYWTHDNGAGVRTHWDIDGNQVIKATVVTGVAAGGTAVIFDILEGVAAAAAF